MFDIAPANCRMQLQAAGKPYPKSGCDVCKNGGLLGCPYEKRVQIKTPVEAKIERSFTFTEESIKVILATYVKHTYGVDASVKDVRGEWKKEPFINQLDPGENWVKFTVTVKE